MKSYAPFARLSIHRGLFKIYVCGLSGPKPERGQKSSAGWWIVRGDTNEEVFYQHERSTSLTSVAWRAELAAVARAFELIPVGSTALIIPSNPQLVDFINRIMSLHANNWRSPSGGSVRHQDVLQRIVNAAFGADGCVLNFSASAPDNNDLEILAELKRRVAGLNHG